MGKVLYEKPDPVHVCVRQMRVRPQRIARFHHRTSAVQRIRNVLVDELRVGIFSNGFGHHVRFVVLDVSQKGRAVLHALEIHLQNTQVSATFK